MRVRLDPLRFPFLASLSHTARSELAALAATRATPKKRLLQRGAAAGGAYLVVAGSLRVYYLTAHGREATLYHVEPGGTCVLALTSSCTDQPYPAWVDAGDDGCEFVRVPNVLLARLLDAEGAFRAFVFQALSGRVFELMQTLEEAGSVQVEQRVARYLVRRLAHQPAREIRVSQIGIASELGTAREVVFRALRSLAHRKLIATGRLRIRVLDRAGLERIAATE